MRMSLLREHQETVIKTQKMIPGKGKEMTQAGSRAGPCWRWAGRELRWLHPGPSTRVLTALTLLIALIALTA